MPILASDTFNVISGTLGGLWTELGAPFVTDMSQDGASAIIDATGWHMALAAGTTQSDHHLQCWLRSTNGSNNVGLFWKYIDSNNFYFLHCTPGVGIRLFKRVAGITSEINIGGVGSIPSGSWFRITVDHVGTTMTIYLDQQYGTVFEGPIRQETDASLVAAGGCGITTTGNTAAGVGGGIAWNDFCVRDGSGDTIYVDLDFNGGAAGEGWGDAARPDLQIDWALNNCGCQRGSKIKLTDPGPYTDAANALQVSIGHAAKFSDAGYTFPTYDPDNGRIIAGNPNLTIEAMDGGRSECRETAANKPFFKIRGLAKGVVFRGIDFTLPGNPSASLRLGIMQTSDHSVQLAKCTFSLTNVGGNQQANTYDALSTINVQVLYCYFKLTTGTSVYFDDIQTRVQRYVAEYSIFQGRAATAPLSAAINAATGADPQAGDAWRIAHCDFIDVYRNLFNDACFAVLDPTNFLADVDYRDNIHRGANGLETTFGVYTGGGAVGGSISCHHNGYHNVTTPRDAGATDAGNEITGDPAFNAPTTAFLWPHSAGQGLNGEGTFAGITLEGDYRPTNPAYLESASDSSTLQGVLDRGALQNFLEPPEPPVPPGPPAVNERIVCTGILYDPNGPNEIDLSAYLLTARALVQERDIVLRSYKAGDMDLEFMDPAGIFNEANPGSFLIDPVTLQQNWFGKRVIVVVTMGGVELTRFVGFVIGLQTGAARGTLRIGNRLQELFQRTPRANTQGKIVSTTNVTGTPSAPPTGGSYIETVDIVPGVTKIETWTFKFLNVTQFEVSGSETGGDGSGDVGSTFTSRSGAITVQPAYWTGVFAAGNRTTIKTIWKNPTTPLTTMRMLREFLTDPLGCNIPNADIDPTFDAYFGSIIDVQCKPFVIDQKTTALDVVQKMATHMGATLIEKTNARLGLATFLPKISDVQTDIICKSDDLMGAEIDHTDIYNEFVLIYDYNEATEEYGEGLIYPPAIANDSEQRYGRRLPAPGQLDLRAFSDANAGWVQFLAQLSYERWKDPRRTFPIEAKIERMNAELSDVYELVSALPDFSAIVEPYYIAKNISGSYTVGMRLVDTVFFFGQRTAADCGYAFHDTPPHKYDSCWRYF
jgi:hypothetical protein